jgi:hypothetical protein
MPTCNLSHCLCAQRNNQSLRPLTKRGCVHVVHTRNQWTNRGYASRLSRAVLDEVPVRGSLTVDSPGCTARAAVSLWLRAGFMGDEELLKCKLADDAAYIGGRSVRLSFVIGRGNIHGHRR